MQKKIHESSRSRTYLCQKCKAKFIHPANSQTNERDAFNTNIWRYNALTPEMQKDILTKIAPSYRAQLRQLEEVIPERSLLDIGAGPGFFLKVAMDLGWRVKGIEVSSAAVKLGDENWNLPYFHGSLESYSDVSKVGVVSLLHILEHQTDPYDFVIGCYNVLLPCGILWIIVPNENSGYYRLKRFLRMRNSTTIEEGKHFVGFSQRGLIKLLKRTSFRPLQVRTVRRGHPIYDPFGLRSGWRAKVLLVVDFAFEFIGLASLHVALAKKE